MGCYAQQPFWGLEEASWPQMTRKIVAVKGKHPQDPAIGQQPGRPCGRSFFFFASSAKAGAADAPSTDAAHAAAAERRFNGATKLGLPEIGDERRPKTRSGEDKWLGKESEPADSCTYK